MNQSVEEQLFSWESWGQQDTLAFNYDKCILKVPIGNYPAGTYVDGISIDFNKSVLYLEDAEGQDIAQFALILSVGEQKG